MRLTNNYPSKTRPKLVGNFTGQHELTLQCDDPAVLAELRRVLTNHFNADIDPPLVNPEPLGQPTWNFEANCDADGCTCTPTANDDKPTPLGQPTWDF